MAGLRLRGKEDRAGAGQAMLMVIFGAGASYDSAPSCPPAQRIMNERPPLAAQLFADRDFFVRAMVYFPEIQAIAPLLRNENVEQTLELLQSEVAVYPGRAAQLVAVRYYLHEMITECQYQWGAFARGITNYKTLLDHVERWRPAVYRRVCLVTFNYDTLLDEALMTDRRMRFSELGDYVSSEAYRLIKAHGSKNWARDVSTRFDDIGGLNDWGIVRRCIERAVDLQVSDDYRVIEARPIARIPNVPSSETVLFPALAVPFATKSAFECPRQHLDVLETSIPEVTKVLIVGWRGMETHFQQLLAGLRPGVKGMIVAGEARHAVEIQKRLEVAGVPGELRTFAGGFTEFVTSQTPYDFLSKE